MKGRSDLPAATTHPESVTGGRGETAVVGIRWVFPTHKITPLTLLHPLPVHPRAIAAAQVSQERKRARSACLGVASGEALLLYDWPLDVRELVLLHRRLVAVHGAEPMLKRSMLPERMTGAPPSTSPSTPPPVRLASTPTPGRSPTSDDIAFDELVMALRAARGNVSQAAASLGITRARAYRLLEARPSFDVRSLRSEDDA